MNLKNLFCVMLCINIFFCCKFSAYGYVLQGPHVLDLMVKKIGVPKRLLVEQRLILFSREPANGEQTGPDEEKLEMSLEFNETLMYQFPEKFRSEISSKNAAKIQVVSDGDYLIIAGDKIIPAGETFFDLYKDILLFRHRLLLQEKLPLKGVDVWISSLGRFQDEIVYVIGAKYPDTSVSQIWINKNTFLPVRWLVKKNAQNGREETMEIRYLEWNKDKTWYPMRIEFYKNDMMMRRIEVDDIKVPPPFSESLFDIGKLKSRYPVMGPGTSENKKSDDDLEDVRKRVENFQKIFE